MIKSKTIIGVSVGALILSAIFIRLYKFSLLPDQHVDELAFGYSAYSILETGADEYNHKLPLVLDSLGDRKLGIYAYFLLPFIALFKLNVWSIRLSAVVLGFAGVILSYFLIKKLFNRQIAFVTSLLILISPWHIMFSRPANEAILALFLTELFVFLFIHFLDKLKIRYLILSLAVLSLAMFSYYSSFVFLPILSVALMFIYPKRSRFKKLIPLIFCGLMLAGFFLKNSSKRISQTSIFQNEETAALISEMIQEEKPGTDPVITRFFHNKPYSYSMVILKNYFQHFSFDFLFFQHHSFYDRYSMPNFGGLYLWELPFILIGALGLIKKIKADKNRNYLLMFIWFLAAFMPNSLSFMGVNRQRTLIVIPAIQFLTAFGLIEFFDWLKTVRQKKIKLIFLGSFLAVFIYNYLSFIHIYFIHYPVHQTWHRDGYAQELVETLAELKQDYSTIVVTETHPHLFLFYNQTPPVKAQELLSQHQTINQAGFLKFSQFDGYIFMPLDCPVQGKKDVLYVCQGQKVPYNSKIIKVIRYADGLPARIFLEFVDQETERTKDLPWQIETNKLTEGQLDLIPETEARYWQVMVD